MVIASNDEKFSELFDEISPSMKPCVSRESFQLAWEDVNWGSHPIDGFEFLFSRSGLLSPIPRSVVDRIESALPPVRAANQSEYRIIQALNKAVDYVGINEAA